MKQKVYEVWVIYNDHYDEDGYYTAGCEAKVDGPFRKKEDADICAKKLGNSYGGPMNCAYKHEVKEVELK